MKLSALDETLMHQASLPFEYAAVSDHRFFDRLMNSAFAPDGSAGITMGMGVYKNMNVVDGFAVVQRDSKTQHNLRLSRALRPNMTTGIGPFRIEIIEPLKSRRYILEPGPGYPHQFDVTFQATLEPHLEDKHDGRIDGRLATDYLRYCQNGVLNGTLGIEGEEIAVRDWYMWRDHSWGVRPNVGGWDPFTGTGGQGTFPSAIRSGGKGLMLFGFGFSTTDFGGYISLIENGQGGRTISQVMSAGPMGAISKSSTPNTTSNSLAAAAISRRWQFVSKPRTGSISRQGTRRSGAHGSSKVLAMTVASTTARAWGCTVPRSRCWNMTPMT
jgi:hypothetical protein